MSAGLPGVALGGLFYLLSALLGPLVELRRASQGRSTPASRRLVARHFAFAAAMLAALDLAREVMALLGGRPGGIPVAGALVGLALLATVLLATKAVELVVAARARRRRARRRPVRVAPQGADA